MLTSVFLNSIILLIIALNRLWRPSLLRLLFLLIIDNDSSIVAQSLVINILKLLMNHTYLPIWDTKTLSIHKTFNCSHLIQQNYIIILNLKIDCVKVTLKKFVLQLIDSSLSQSKVEDSAEDFEKILGHVFAVSFSWTWLVWFADLDVEFVRLLGNHVRHDAWSAED